MAIFKFFDPWTLLIVNQIAIQKGYDSFFVFFKANEFSKPKGTLKAWCLLLYHEEGRVRKTIVLCLDLICLCLNENL